MKKNVLRINGYFVLPDDFSGNRIDALELFLAYTKEHAPKKSPPVSKSLALSDDDLWLDGNYNEELPVWWNNEEFYASHRSALLFKNYEHYSKFGWKENPKYDYVWPV